VNAATRIGAVLAAALMATVAVAQYSGVLQTVHNLSVSGPGEIRSETETEVCKFCHIPHSAVVNAPLWGHQLSNVKHYDTASVRTGAARVAAPQPDGSSRLCLSCHDGTVALGDIGGKSNHDPAKQTLLFGRGANSLGTDLSGSHPISFVVADAAEGNAGADMAMRPLAAIRTDRDVRLDAAGKMQCSTCHDPHSDRNFVRGSVPHFSVKPSVSEICLACHELR
jgi:hypothetical protein